MSNLSVSRSIKMDYFDECTLAQKSLINKRQELTQMVADYKKRRDKEFNEYCLKFVEENCPYKKHEIIEAKSRWGTRRMQIDHLMLRWIGGVPVITAHGFFISRKGKPTKRYHKKGYGVYGVQNKGVTLRGLGRYLRPGKPERV